MEFRGRVTADVDGAKFSHFDRPRRIEPQSCLHFAIWSYDDIRISMVRKLLRGAKPFPIPNSWRHRRKAGKKDWYFVPSRPAFWPWLWCYCMLPFVLRFDAFNKDPADKPCLLSFFVWCLRNILWRELGGIAHPCPSMHLESSFYRNSLRSDWISLVLNHHSLA